MLRISGLWRPSKNPAPKPQNAPHFGTVASEGASRLVRLIEKAMICLVSELPIQIIAFSMRCRMVDK